MATKDLLTPGNKPGRTPKGRTTEIPAGLTTPEVERFLVRADEEYDSDPNKIALEERNSRRRQRWERQQAPLRAFREMEQAVLDQNPDAQIDPVLRDEHWKAFRSGWREGQDSKARQDLFDRARASAERSRVKKVFGQNPDEN